jgi:hypothetical protein
LNKKKWLIIGSLVAFFGCVIVAAAVVFIYTFYSRIRSMMPETPPDLRQARVVLGSELFQKDKLIPSEGGNQKSRSIGEFEDIAVGNLDGKDGTDIVVAGRNGAALFDMEGRKQSQVLFEKPTSAINKILDIDRLRSIGDIQIVDLENDGKCEYFGSGSIDGTAVFDHQGKQLWQYGERGIGNPYIKDMAVGDLDGDGTKEFALLNNGLEMLDSAGRVKWSKPRDVPNYNIAIGDIDNDGKPEIINTGWGGCFISDAKGDLLKTIRMPVFSSQFETCKLPDKKELSLLTVYEGFIWILSFEGKTLYQWEIPLSRFVSETKNDEFGSREETSVYTTKSVWGKFFKDQPECLDVVTRFAGLDSSVFYIYNQAGQLLYQEVLPEESQAIALVPHNGNNQMSDLLIAGRKTVWRYAVK